MMWSSRSLPDPVIGVFVGVVGGYALLSLPPLVAIALLLGVLALGAVSSFSHVDRMATSLVILTAFTMPMGGQFIAGVPLPDIVLPLAVGAGILVRVKEGTRRPSVGTYRLLVAGVVMIAVSGLIGAVFEAPGPFLYQGTSTPLQDVSGWGNNIGNLVKFILGASLPIILWVLTAPSRALCRRIAEAFLLGCALSAAVGLLLPIGRFGPRWIGLAVSPIPFGEICLLAMGPAVGLLLLRRRPHLLSLVAIPLLGLGVVMSGSRSALGGMLIFLAVIGLLTKNRMVIGSVLCGVVAVLLVLGLGLVTPQGESAVSRILGNTSTASNSDTIRSDLAEKVLDRYWERPITGNGLNYMRPSHNFYLGLLASGGVLGLAGFATIVGGAVTRMLARRTDMLVVGITASFLGYLAAAYYDYTFWWRWLWFYIGMVYAIGATSTTTSGRDAFLAEDDVAADPADVRSG